MLLRRQEPLRIGEIIAYFDERITNGGMGYMLLPKKSCYILEKSLSLAGFDMFLLFTYNKISHIRPILEQAFEAPIDATDAFCSIRGKHNTVGCSV